VARIDDLLIAAIKAAGPKPADDAPQGIKNPWVGKLSNTLAMAIAQELRHRGMKEARPATPGELGLSGAERRLAGGIGAKKVDVTWATAWVRGSARTVFEHRDELIERFQFDPSKKIRTYSSGNRQKVSIIAALMTRADLLVLDEPTAGLDPLMEQEFRRHVLEARDRGQTVFLSSHILAEVEALCDRLAILRKGILVELGTLPRCAISPP